jgi:hypothetical protein
MQKSNEIKSACENFTYYVNETKKNIEDQLKLDLERGKELGFNDNAQSIRFDALAAIHTACDAIQLYVMNIQTNLKYCEEQDKILNKPEE